MSNSEVTLIETANQVKDCKEPPKNRMFVLISRWETEINNDWEAEIFTTYEKALDYLKKEAEDVKKAFDEEDIEFFEWEKVEDDIWGCILCYGDNYFFKWVIVDGIVDLEYE